MACVTAFRRMVPALYVRGAMAGDLDAEVGTGISFGVSSRFIRTDGNGDGLDDIAILNPGSNLTIYHHYGSDVPTCWRRSRRPGVTQEVTYTTIARRNYAPGSGLTYRTARCLARCMWSARSRAPIMALTTLPTTTQGNEPGGAWLLPGSRRSNRWIRATASSTSAFEQQFPKTGMLLQDNLYQPGGTPIREQTFTLGYQTLSATTNNQRQAFPTWMPWLRTFTRW